MKKQKMGGFGFYMFVLILIGCVWYFVSTMGNDKIEYNYSDFINDLANDKVEKVIINQNEKVPTGSLKITLLGESKSITVYISDVNDAIEQMMKAEFTNYKLMDVKGESILLTVILPLGISVITIIIIFVLFSERPIATV